jgi:hypothetical protein
MLALRFLCHDTSLLLTDMSCNTDTFPTSRIHITMMGNVPYYQSPNRRPIQSQNSRILSEQHLSTLVPLHSLMQTANMEWTFDLFC